MLIVKMWHYFKGYVIIKVQGFSVEKFLNLMVKEEIFVWDIYRESSTILYMKISRQDFKTLKSIMKKVPCNIEIIDKRGLPFIIWKIKRRKFLAIGATISLILIYFLTSLIWTIEVVGNEEISREEILQQLQEMGVERGKFKHRFEEESLENKLLGMNPEISYLNIQFIGTKVKVSIVEKEEPPSIIDENVTTRVIAKRDGIIDRILVYSGNPVVEEGELVKKGDLLISGEIQEGERTKTYASGDVYARTWYEDTLEISRVVEERDEKEKVVEKTLIIGKKEISVRKRNIPYKKYDKIVETTPLSEMMGVKLPIYIKTIEYYPLKEKGKLTESEIKEKALEKIIKKIEGENHKEIEIVQSDMKVLENGDMAKVEIFLEVIEEISIMEEIQ